MGREIPLFPLCPVLIGRQAESTVVAVSLPYSPPWNGVLPAAWVGFSGTFCFYPRTFSFLDQIVPRGWCHYISSPFTGDNLLQWFLLALILVHYPHLNTSNGQGFGSLSWGSEQTETVFATEHSHSACVVDPTELCSPQPGLSVLSPPSCSPRTYVRCLASSRHRKRLSHWWL